MTQGLVMKNITIDFPGVRALDNAQFHLEYGQVHALIGANGAGKSTLMKVLSGAYTHYTGEILIDNKNVQIRSPKDASDLGIQIVYQEVDTALIPYLTVGENIMLHDMVTGMGKKQFIQYRHIHHEATKILDELQMNMSSKQLVQQLTLAEKQMVLIARAISSQCKILILDEPTAPLSSKETKQLFEIVRKLKQDGVGIVFISHRLQELMEICDQITIMRNGKYISCEAIATTTVNHIVEQMLGKRMDEQFPVVEKEIGEPLFEVEQLADGDKVQDITLHVKKGEIIGLAGLVGAGKTEICKAIFGVSAKTSGKLVLNNRELKIKTPYHAVKSGIAFVPEERRKEGIFVEEDVKTNVTAANLHAFTKSFSFLHFAKEKQKAKEMVSQLDVKTPTIDTKLQHLSGGNQQKIAIGKWLVTDADVYIFDEPTKGVDVGSKKDIFTLILELAKRGKAVIYASSELQEILGITDRCYVIYDGKVKKELQTNEATEEMLLYYSTGGS